MSDYFNSTKYERRTLRTRGTLEEGSVGDIVTGEAEQSTTVANRRVMDVRVRDYIDGSDYLANELNQKIGFYHVPSKREVYFKAFLTAFNETYSPNWSEESVYGRADPIYLFKQTVRNITMGVKIPASTVGEASENLLRVQRLVQFLYPAYGDTNSGTTITQSPLIRLSFQNLVRSYKDGTSGDQLGLPGIDHAAVNGLLGIIKNLTINYNMEGDVGVFQLPGGKTLPKLIEINFDFGVVHEHSIGWKNQTPTGREGESGTTTYSFSEPSFPYGMRAGTTRANANEVQQSVLDERPVAEGGNLSAIEQQHRAATAEEQAQQAEANEQARYLGLFGSIRQAAQTRRNREETPPTSPPAAAATPIVDPGSQGVTREYLLSTGMSAADVDFLIDGPGDFVSEFE